MNKKDSGNNFLKGLGVTVAASIITTIVTLLVTRAFHVIYPEENKVVITDTLRVVEAGTPQIMNDSSLFVLINELNRTIRETIPRNNNINIVWPEKEVSSGLEKKNTHIESVVSSASIADNGKGEIKPHVIIRENPNVVNTMIDKKGFYKKGYMISDGGVFYVLEKIPKVDDYFLTIEIRLIQPADLLSHIYLTMYNTNVKGEMYQFFGQTFEVKDGLNRIKIANNLREGKNTIEIGVFMKSDAGKDYPTFYRSIFTLVK